MVCKSLLKIILFKCFMEMQTIALQRFLQSPSKPVQFVSLLLEAVQLAILYSGSKRDNHALTSQCVLPSAGRYSGISEICLLNLPDLSEPSVFPLLASNPTLPCFRQIYPLGTNTISINNEY